MGSLRQQNPGASFAKRPGLPCRERFFLRKGTVEVKAAIEVAGCVGPRRAWRGLIPSKVTKHRITRPATRKQAKHDGKKRASFPQACR